MSVLGDRDYLPAGAVPAGGTGSLADIAGATWDSFRYIENTTASYNALYEAIERRNAAIHARAGVQLSNPLRDAEDEWRRETLQLPAYPWSLNRVSSRSTPREKADYYNRHLDTYRGELATLTEKFADARDVIAADRNPWDDAAEIARQADERLGVLMASRSGLGKYGALLAGGVVGSLEDPVTLLSLGLGAGPGAARTVAGRILSVAGKEAIINAATEAAMQPAVQAWRGRIGLDAGMDDAIRNVVFAGAMGGAFGGAFGAAGEALSRFMRPADTERAAQALAADARVPEAARQLLAGDGLQNAAALAEIRSALRADARGAIDAAESIRVVDAARPPAARPDRYDATLAEADRVVQLPAYADDWAGFRPDPVQVERVVRAIAGDAEPSARAVETPLIDFLIARGGVADFKGELRAIGAGEISERFRGRLVKEGGDSLDYAREAAAEAGFFNHLYGDAETAGNRSTVADLLDALEEEVRARTGGPRASEESALGSLEGIVADVARLAGPDVDDAIIARAARMSFEDGVDAADALERVIMGDELAGNALPPARADDGGIPDPAHFEDDLMIGEADLAAIEALDADFDIPFFDDVPAMKPAAFRDFMERQENFARVAEACRA